MGPKKNAARGIQPPVDAMDELMEDVTVRGVQSELIDADEILGLPAARPGRQRVVTSDTEAMDIDGDEGSVDDSSEEDSDDYEEPDDADDNDLEGSEEEEVDTTSMNEIAWAEKTAKDNADAKECADIMHKVALLPDGGMKRWCARAHQAARKKQNVELKEGVAEPNPVNPYASLKMIDVLEWMWDAVTLDEDMKENHAFWDKRTLPQKEIIFHNFDEEWKGYTNVVTAAVPRLTGACVTYFARAVALRDDQAVHVVPKPIREDRRDDAAFCQEHFESTKRKVNRACGVRAEQAWAKHCEQTAHMDNQRWAEIAVVFRDEAARGNAKRGLSPQFPGETPEFGFGTRISGIQGQWVATGKLGEGANGTAYLWVRYDQFGEVMDRTVIKEQKDVYHLPHCLIGDEIRENVIHRELSHAPTSKYPDSIVGWRGFGRVLGRNCFRIYMNHCIHGDLEQLLKAQLQLKGIRDPTGKPLNLWIPTPVVWCVLEAMAKALCSLETAMEVPIIHLDIKGVNVFIDASNGKNAEWPILKARLGDFGNSYPTPYVTAGFRPKNPRDYRGRGTPGCNAPEAMHYPNKRDYEDIKVTSAADVWAVGALIICLMFGTCYLAGEELMFDNNVEADIRKDRRNPWYKYTEARQSEVVAKYPQELVRIAQWCCHMDPAQRPNPTQLVESIQAFTCTDYTDWESDDDTMPINRRRLADTDILKLPNDRFARLAR